MNNYYFGGIFLNMHSSVPKAEKPGLGLSIQLKLCQLVKTAEGGKAYSINTEAQWDVERPLPFDCLASSILQGSVLI